MTANRRLLILSCSQRKRSDPELLPAIERYNGPIFQVLCKYLRENPIEAQTIDIYILSAKFGLIPANKRISNYNYKMTLARAQELQPQVLPIFKRILQEQDYHELFINLGKTYWQTFENYEKVLPVNLKVILAQGSQGRRQADLHKWLYGKLPKQPTYQTRGSQQNKVRIRGIEITLTPKQVLDIARQALAEGRGDSTSYQSWYIMIDEQPVAPKWLVSQLTGLSVSSFHTGEARRVLQQLGFEVKRT